MSVERYLTDDERRKVIDEVIVFFSSERGEEIGVIAAERVLDEVLEVVGDAMSVVRQRAEEMVIDVETLKKV